MGSFYQEVDPNGDKNNKSYWYGDRSNFVNLGYPWFARGGQAYSGSAAGNFAFFGSTGYKSGSYTFRVVLTPSEQ